MAGWSEIYKESGDATQEVLNGINSWEVNLDGAVRYAKNLVNPNWEGMAKAEFGRWWWGSSERKKSPELQAEEDIEWWFKQWPQVKWCLKGYTTEAMQRKTALIIKGLENWYEALWFLMWYNCKIDYNGWKIALVSGSMWVSELFSGLWQGDGFFEQLYTEDKFPQKDKLIKRVALLIADFRDKQGKDSGKIRSICKKSGLNENDVKYLTKIEEETVGFVKH